MKIFVGLGISALNMRLVEGVIDVVADVISVVKFF